jgi:hypothetical protein
MGCADAGMRRTSIGRVRGVADGILPVPFLGDNVIVCRLSYLVHGGMRLCGSLSRMLRDSQEQGVWETWSARFFCSSL